MGGEGGRPDDLEQARAEAAAPEPDRPDVADLLAASSLGDPVSKRTAARAPTPLAVAVASPPDACPRCGDAGLLPGDEWCDCPAGRYWSGSTALDEGERPVVTFAPPAPQCVTCGDTGYVQPRTGHPYETCNCPAGAALAQADQEST